MSILVPFNCIAMKFFDDRFSVNSSNTQLEMLTDGKFEQHVLIQNFFESSSAESLSLRINVKIGGTFGEGIIFKRKKEKQC